MLHHIPRPFGLGIFLWWTVQDSNRAAAHSAASNQLSGLLLSPRVPTRRNVYRGSCKSKDFMAFLFFWQSLHTFAHLLHTLQKSHELFASLAQRVFRCTKIKLVGARPLHLAYARPLCCLKAPLGLSLLRKRKFFTRRVPASARGAPLRPSAGWLQGSFYP